VQARDVMTRQVVTVGPDTSAEYAGEVMAEHGFAALPVVDDDHQLVGIVAEADVLRDRVPPDPRLHLRRDGGTEAAPPALLVRGVMTQDVRSVEATADVADIARVFVDERVRSAPVVDGQRRGTAHAREAVAMRPSSPSGPVVVGADASDDSRVACAFATEEARRRNAPLQVLHALARPLGGAAADPAPDERLRTAVDQGARALLRTVAGDAAYVLGADRVDWSAVDDDPVTALRAAPREARPVVVGSRGTGGIGGLLLGCTAIGPVTDAACPVGVLPDRTSVVVSPRTCVVAGAEGRPGDEAVLAPAFAEAAARGTDLVAVHSWQDAVLETAFERMARALVAVALTAELPGAVAGGPSG
jgi:CBS domain-containing protein